MSLATNPEKKQDNHAGWQKIVAKYHRPDLKRSLWQAVNSLIPFFAIWYLMYLSLGVSYWITLGLGLIGSGFLMRIFIISHDCGHGSFFRSRKANNSLGALTSLLTFIPYHRWRHEHAVHHATAGDLDGRGFGDIWTLTVQEYLDLPRHKRLGYRLYRNPFVMFGIGAIFVFLIKYRFSRPACGRREKLSNWRTNFVLLVVSSVLIYAVGLKAFVLVQLPITVFASGIGVWMFYVQHQFEGVYWDRHEDWDYVKEAMEGSSFYKLPKVLQWFSGNIGFHHIHHLSPRIPNYFLEKCHRENKIFQDVKHITPISSLKSLRFRLWDEERRQLVGFGYLRSQRGKQIPAT